MGNDSARLALPPDVEDRMARERIAWLCTLRPDGSPHVTPVWYVYRDLVWWISSGERNAKVRNVAADGRVSLALDGGLHPVVAEGTATVHRDGFPPDVLAAFAEKYDGWDASKVWPPFGARVLLEVPVTRWLLAGTAQ
ncbi:pyridoxamine 5'-phosphate oxidase family protein [Marinitenerispora sediminis]|uniref:Pyridoxamine 5'-phosphate oxidase n=1 Tax=Marinitenerispora sediminis TaxID=1931232 RepID=A0A368T412_9ACTN|nr:pyridoxamine 5'-phosphate oxidase family protein [Marinitenerispora sediminis]RCV49809.1 pyridoxamine 5'-phosphate oxidase [Marinitenerispora sediminis]RCV52662.1 pyridoxamine 5'-phosphate oxidase [Marinitenerispora sediminis]RCV55780.1 pyridoxamine 5'-phosphate oxidase [Marinitenerispora sediminis]